MAVREQPLAYHRPRPCSLPPPLDLTNAALGCESTIPNSLCKSSFVAIMGECTASRIHSSAPPPWRTLLLVASTSTCESVNARRRGRRPFAVTTPESGEWRTSIQPSTVRGSRIVWFSNV
ncbi:hypothetical protein PMIN03_001107 [Paraphaeosphaeria minitans]